MRDRERERAKGFNVMRAAGWLPLLFVASWLLNGGTADAQTSGLPAPMSGDCAADNTGAVTCTKSGGVTLAPSATVDATNAANLSSGVLPAARLAAGAVGTAASYGANGQLQPAVAAPFAANAGPVKVAPFNVSAQTSAGAAVLGPSAGDTSFRYLNLTNGARLLTGGNVVQVKTFVNSVQGATALYFEVWRVNASGTFSLVGRSGNLLGATNAGAANVYTLAAPIAVTAGDYVGMDVEGSFASAVNVFSGSTAYGSAAYPSYSLRNVGLTSTADFMGSGTSSAAGAIGNENPIEVYLDKGPVVACLGDSKMQGIPFSGNYLQAAFDGNLEFPVVAQLNYSTAGLGTSLIDASNQPCAYIGRTLGYTVANLAITGSTSTVQLSSALPAALALKPAVLVVSGTVNDPAYSVSSATSLSNYQSMYTQAVAAGVQRVVFTGVEPATSASDAWWAVAESTNTQLKSWCVAQAACVWVGDQVAAALGQYRTTGTAGNLRNIQPAFAAADGLHFNNAGAQQMGSIEANGIEPPSTLGATVAVAGPRGNRVRSVQPLGADGTLGWRWMDVRDFLQMEPQMERNAPLTAGQGNIGQQSVGCVVFTVGRGYVRCDGSLRWDLQSQTLSAGNVNASGTVQMAGQVQMNGTLPANANITKMYNASPTGGGGIANLQGYGTHSYNLEAFGTGQSGFGGTLGLFDNTLSKFLLQFQPDGTMCVFGDVGSCQNVPYKFTTSGQFQSSSVSTPQMAMSGAVSGSANITQMYNSASNGGGGIVGLQGYGTHSYNIEAFGTGQSGYGGTLGIFDQTLSKFVLQFLPDGTVCTYGGLGACLNAPFKISPAGAVTLTHLQGGSAAPTVTAGTAASGCTVSGTDLAFTLSCTTGTAPTAGTLATVTFAQPYGSAPRFAQPGAANAASAPVVAALYASATGAALTVSAASALPASGSFSWNFVLVQ